MKPRILSFASLLVAIAWSAPSLALAQTPGYISSGGHSDNPNGPTVSPYMNLLQNNNQFNTTPNYQSLVKPLIDQQSAIQRQGNGLQRLQQQVNSGGGAGLGGGGGRGTGHTTFFMNFSHYYPGRGR
jgi:hypothetical protein